MMWEMLFHMKTIFKLSPIFISFLSPIDLVIVPPLFGSPESLYFISFDQNCYDK